jgi:hypothetical protein
MATDIIYNLSSFLVVSFEKTFAKRHHQTQMVGNKNKTHVPKAKNRTFCAMAEEVKSDIILAV